MKRVSASSYDYEYIIFQMSFIFINENLSPSLDDANLGVFVYLYQLL